MIEIFCVTVNKFFMFLYFSKEIFTHFLVNNVKPFYA